MRYKLITLVLLLFNVVSAKSQNLSGFYTGDYIGVHSVFTNPANIAGNKYKWDVNLAAVNGFVGNNHYNGLRLRNLSGSFHADSLVNRLIREQAGLLNAQAGAAVTAPAAMFSLNKKSAIALSLRTRLLVNLIDVDSRLLDNVLNSGSTPLPYTLAVNGMGARMNAFSEVGLSYASTLLVKSRHVIKGGVTVKYLSGIANAHLNTYELRGTVAAGSDNDIYLTEAGGGVRLGAGGVALNNLKASELTRFSNTGWGTDLGLVYELKQNIGGKAGIDHKLRVGISVMDLGYVKYTRDPNRSGDYSINTAGGEQLNLTEAGSQPLDGIKSYFDSRTDYFTRHPDSLSGTLKLNIPTTGRIDVDYRVWKRMFLNLSGQINLLKDCSCYSGFSQDFYSLTPRYETSKLGVYLPVSYGSMTGVNAGVAVKAGPLFVGSNSILTALGSSKQMDVYAGLRFGKLRKDKPRLTEGIVDTFSVNPHLQRPVEFVQWSAVHRKDNIELNWRVAVNKSISHFDVEKSTDSINFTVIANVKDGERSGNNIVTYTSADHGFSAGDKTNVFYRIKVVKINGEIAYSNILTVGVK